MDFPHASPTTNWKHSWCGPDCRYHSHIFKQWQLEAEEIDRIKDELEKAQYKKAIADYVNSLPDGLKEKAL
jgi:hypothetical protein